MAEIPELKSIIAEIRTARQKRSIRSSALAKASGISPSAMSKLERGMLKPSYDLVYKVLEALDDLIAAQGASATISATVARGVISVSVIDTISKAREIMKKNDISQLPVVDNDGRILGLVTEKSILDNPEAVTCGNALEFSYAVLGPEANLEKARQLVRNTQAILVVEESKLVGILTKADFL